MTAIHQQLVMGRWQTLTLAEQLGNAGSEYERACRAKENNDLERFESAAARLLELLELTITDPRWRNHRLKELCRLRGQVRGELYGKHPERLWGLKNYFFAFAWLARSGK